MMSRLRLRTAGASTEDASSSASLFSSSGMLAGNNRELSSSARKVTSKHRRSGAARPLRGRPPADGRHLGWRSTTATTTFGDAAFGAACLLLYAQFRPQTLRSHADNPLSMSCPDLYKHITFVVGEVNCAV